MRFFQFAPRNKNSHPCFAFLPLQPTVHTVFPLAYMYLPSHGKLHALLPVFVCQRCFVCRRLAHIHWHGLLPHNARQYMILHQPLRFAMPRLSGTYSCLKKSKEKQWIRIHFGDIISYNIKRHAVFLLIHTLQPLYCKRKERPLQPDLFSQLCDSSF